MIHWSNFYTHWFVILSLFEKYLGFSVYPGMLVSLFGSIILSVMYNISFEILIFLTLMHLIPFIWISRTSKDVLYNLIISGLYLIYLNLQQKNIYNIYDEQYRYLSHIKSLEKFIKNPNTYIFS